MSFEVLFSTNDHAKLCVLEHFFKILLCLHKNRMFQGKFM